MICYDTKLLMTLCIFGNMFIFGPMVRSYDIIDMDLFIWHPLSAL